MGWAWARTEFADIFTEWNKGELDSFLMEISATIFGEEG